MTRKFGWMAATVMAATMLTAGACGDGDNNDNERDSDSESTPTTDAGVDSGAGDDAGDDVDDTDTGADTESEAPAALEIVGNYVSDWGAEVTITTEEWQDVSDFGTMRFAIETYDNDADFLAARNSEDNDFNPSMWSRFEWTYEEDALYYCQVLFAESALEDVSDKENLADADDLSEGCAGFPWTKLTVAGEEAPDGGVSDAGE